MNQNLFICLLVALFINSESVAQSIIGYEWIACNVYADSTFLKFEDDTMYYKFIDDDEFQPISTYEINNNVISLIDTEFIEICDPWSIGVYTLNQSQDTLSFETISDPCEEREFVFSQLILKNTSIVNVDERIKPVLSVYPNPTLDWIYVNGISKGIYLYKLFDSKGSLESNGTIKQGENISTVSLNNGLYILTIENKELNLIESFKLMKE